MLQNLQMKPVAIERAQLPYMLYLPQGYEDQPEKKWPLVIFLHGAGERGTDLEGVYRHGVPKRVRAGDEFPFILAAPQISGQRYWAGYTETLNSFLDELIATLRVDEDRVYLTGLSMGGTGTWMWAMANPERFAAIAPMCGTGICWCAGNLGRVPVWTFHGDQDTTIPIDESIRMVERLKACGGDVRLTVYEGYGHDCWTAAYQRDDLYEWLLSKTRQKR